MTNSLRSWLQAEGILVQDLPDFLERVKVIDCRINPYWERCGMPEEHFTNASFLLGGDEIVVGVYTKPELRLASFFHEVGHLLSRKHEGRANWLPSWWERDAWREGFAWAASLGVTFSPEVEAWAEAQVATYLPEDEEVLALTRS